MTRDTGDLIW